MTPLYPAYLCQPDTAVILCCANYKANRIIVSTGLKPKCS
jgi:hypothetical protein